MPAEALRTYLDRLLTHPGWGGSPRRSAFLRHIACETIAGHGARLKGAAIAVEVFGSRPGSDTQADAIVRVEARRLRRDLDSYYVGPGREDPIRLRIPKGGYRVEFDLIDPVALPRQHSAQGSAFFYAPPQTGFSPPDHARRQIDARAWADHGGAPQPRVMVYPFVARGGPDTLRDLADGLTFEVISGLARFPDFVLHSVEDTFGLLPNTSNAAAFAPGTFMVRGTVQSDTAQIKVSVLLSEASDGRVVWSRTFTRPLSAHSLITVQSAIAGDIASALGEPAPGLREGLIARVARSGGPSMESYLAVVTAQAYRRTHVMEAYADTRDALERAIESDPCYADAWAYLAFLRLDGIRFGHEQAAAKDIFTPAMNAARRALALDPENVQGHLALLLIQHYAGLPDDARATAESALRISPHDPDTLASAGWLRIVAHNDPEGLSLLEQALTRSVNPPPRYFRSLAVHRMMWGKPEAFLQAAIRAAADGMGITAALLAIALARAGRAGDAVEALQTVIRHSPALSRDPAGFLAPHRTHPAIIEQIAQGLQAVKLLSQPG